MELIDRSKLEPDTEWSDYDEGFSSYSAGQIKNAPIVKAIPLDKIKQAREALKQEPCEDVMAIHTQGLDEEIRCTMCTNHMRSDRGCDGGCMFDEDMYEKVMDIIRNHFVSSTTPTRKKGHWIITNNYLTAAYGSIDYVKCSCCGEESLEEGDYCPNCGSYMKGEFES